MIQSRRYDPSTSTLVLAWDKEEPPDLRDPGCLRAVLEILREEPRVESLVLAHRRERRYGRKTLGVLQAFLDVLRLTAQLATRDPTPDFPGESPRQTRARCAACPLRPAALFPRLARQLPAGLQEFHAEFELRAHALSRRVEPGCARCLGLTRRDLEILAERYAALCTRVGGA